MLVAGGQDEGGGVKLPCFVADLNFILRQFDLVGREGFGKHCIQRQHQCDNQIKCDYSHTAAHQDIIAAEFAFDNGAGGQRVCVGLQHAHA